MNQAVRDTTSHENPLFDGCWTVSKKRTTSTHLRFMGKVASLSLNGILERWGWLTSLPIADNLPLFLVLSTSQARSVSYNLEKLRIQIRS